MSSIRRALGTLGLSTLAACTHIAANAPSAPGPVSVSPTGSEGRSASAVAARAPSPLELRFVDHLSFGARIERAAVLVDGLPAYEAEGTALRETARVAIRPGEHTLGVLLVASEPCGLFDQPRTAVTVEATTSLHAGSDTAGVRIDLAGSEATSDPLRSLGVRFVGYGVVLGGSESTPPAGCGKDDVLCAVTARVEEARARGDARGLACYAPKQAEMKALREIVDESYATLRAQGLTSGAAEKAQLRARYGEERMRALAIAAEACDARSGAVVATNVARKVERACPAVDAPPVAGRF